MKLISMEPTDLSSILNALKKLEKEREDKLETEPWLKKSQIRKTISSNSGFRHFLKKTAPWTVVMALVVLVIVGGYLFCNNPWEKPDKPDKILSDIKRSNIAKYQKLQLPKVNLTEKVSQVPQTPETSPIHQTPETPPIQQRQKAIESQQTVKLPMQSQTSKEINTKNSKKILALKPSQIHEQDAIKHHPATAPDTNVPPHNEKKMNLQAQTVPEENSDQSLPYHDDPGIELQAIAWDNIPGNRIAVINNRIVRQGASIDGIIVKRIGKNEIIFQDGDKKWIQKFKLK